jgi:hypothetical protein
VVYLHFLLRLLEKVTHLNLLPIEQDNAVGSYRRMVSS